MKAQWRAFFIAQSFFCHGMLKYWKNTANVRWSRNFPPLLRTKAIVMLRMMLNHIDSDIYIYLLLYCIEATMHITAYRQHTAHRYMQHLVLRSGVTARLTPFSVIHAYDKFIMNISNCKKVQVIRFLFLYFSMPQHYGWAFFYQNQKPPINTFFLIRFCPSIDLLSISFNWLIHMSSETKTGHVEINCFVTTLNQIGAHTIHLYENELHYVFLTYIL